MNEEKANINMGGEREGTGDHNTVQIAREGTDAHKGPHPTSTPPPSLRYTQDEQKRRRRIVGTGAGGRGVGPLVGVRPLLMILMVPNAFVYSLAYVSLLFCSPYIHYPFLSRRTRLQRVTGGFLVNCWMVARKMRHWRGRV